MALFDRAEARDFVDVYTLSDRFDLDNLLDLAGVGDDRPLVVLHPRGTPRSGGLSRGWWADAADVVLLVDRIDPLATGLAVAQGARRIALQSVVLGIGLSMIGMVAAALGWLTPVQGALIQEAIDVAAIMNALRALRVGQPPG